MTPPSAEAITRQHVRVVPFTDLLHSGEGRSDHRGGPVWEQFVAETVVRHCRAGVPVDDPPEPPDGVVETIDRATWCGPIVRHFGHQVADFSMRLVASVRADPTATLLFATHPRVKLTTIADAQPHVRDILAWLGVPFDQVRIATQPVLVRELSVLPQQEQPRGPGPSDWYLDRLDERVARQLPAGPARPTGALYVSRAGMTARFAGEAYLEEHLAAHGVTVLRPETVPVVAQLEAYRSADLLLFADGSAIHGLQLLGRGLGDIVVLCRRPGVRVAEPSLVPRARSLAYLDLIAGSIQGLTPTGRPAYWTGMPILDVPRLLDHLEPLGVASAAAWDRRRFADAQEADLRAWMVRARPADGWSAAARAGILSSLTAVGLGDLADALEA